MDEIIETRKRTFFDGLRAASVVFRTANGLTQADLGKIIGAGASSVSDFETGNTLLRESALEKLIELVWGVNAFMARRLREVADYLDSDASDELKKKRVYLFVQEYAAALGLALVSVDKIGNDVEI